MAKKRKQLSKNMIASVLARVVVLVTGLLVQRYILVAYGSTLNGLTSSITQVMSYLVLLEAGLGTASIQALYEPLVKEDWNGVSGVVTATGKEYKKISALFTIFLLLASFLIPFAVRSEVELFIAGLLTFITGGSYVVSYILGGKYKVILSADRKIYVLYYLDILSSIISCVIRIFLLINGANIIVVQLAHLFSVFIKNAGYVIYVKRHYSKIDYKYKPNMRAISKRWNVLIHSIAGIVVNHTDVVILTVFASLKTVSVYSVYNLVFSQLSSLTQTTFLQAPQASFGRLYNQNKERFEEAYTIFETGFTIFLYIISTAAIILILPFISVYTDGVSDTVYIDKWLPILFTFILLMNQIRVPVIVVINVAGAFKETQKGAIIEALINIVISMVLFFGTKLGLYGLLIGTVCSFLYRTTDVILYAYKHLLSHSISTFVKTLVVNSLTAGLFYILFCVMFPINVDNLWMWLINAVVISIIVSVGYTVMNLLFCYREMIRLMKKILRLGR